jgi:hypothetical protein
MIWFHSTRLFEMFALADAYLGDRKRRLFAVACCRRVCEGQLDPRSLNALRVAELFADGLADEEQRRLAEDAAFDAFLAMRESRLMSDQLYTWSRQAELLTNACLLAVSLGRLHAHDAADFARWSLSKGWDEEQQEEARQCDLLREIVGPRPAASIAFAASWRYRNDSAARRLAEVIYNDQLFEDMPILGDALQDAGCEDERILRHCYEPGNHLRGCWVVDLVRCEE